MYQVSREPSLHTGARAGAVGRRGLHHTTDRCRGVRVQRSRTSAAHGRWNMRVRAEQTLRLEEERFLVQFREARWGGDRRLRHCSATHHESPMMSVAATVVVYRSFTDDGTEPRAAAEIFTRHRRRAMRRFLGVMQLMFLCGVVSSGGGSDGEMPVTPLPTLPFPAPSVPSLNARGKEEIANRFVGEITVGQRYAYFFTWGTRGSVRGNRSSSTF